MNRGAIILCGGESRRMGRDKATLPFGPAETLLERVVRLVAEEVPAERIVCVAASEQLLPPLPAAVQIVRDGVPHGGPLAGFASGMAALRDRVDAAFVCGCDAPLLVPAFVTRMFELVDGYQIAVPLDGERLHPLASVYRTEVLALAESLLANGERRLMALVERCDTRRVTADELRVIDQELASLANCNTPEEYQAAVGRAFHA
jgi:molybdopterin-guanine dinucleotide biosynthesis protein A